MADNWLKTNIDPLISSAAFRQVGLLVIAFDEATGTDIANGGGKVAVVIAGMNVLPAYQGSGFYQHQSTLRTVAQALGLSAFPGAASTAPAMGEFFGNTVNSPPTLSSISPASGSTAGGTSVTLTGTNFATGATVSFDSSAATNVVVVNSTTITAATPAHAAGGSSVKVINPDGQSATLGPATVQLLTNAGYESGTGFWRFSGSGTAAVQNTAANAHSGNSYAELTSAAGNHPVYYAATSSGTAQYFQVSSGDVITFGGWGYRVSGNGKARWGIEITDSNKLNPSYLAASPFNVGSASWVNFQSSYTAVNDGFVRFYAEINGNTTPTTVRFDDAFLQQRTAGGFNYLASGSATH